MSVARVEAHDGRSSHWWQPQIAVLLLAVSLLVISGCAMGPRALRFNRQKYNEAVTRTNREELLLNLVRLRYGDTPEVLPIGSVTTGVLHFGMSRSIVESASASVASEH